MVKTTYRRLIDLLEARHWNHDSVEEAKSLLLKEKTSNLLHRRKSHDDGLLHVAMACGAPAEVVQVMVNQIPKAAQMVTKFGRHTPLHRGMDGNAPADSIKVVVEAFPEAVKLKDSNGLLPLHLGMYKRANVNAIKLVLEAYPEAATLKDGCGQTPLHSGTELGFPQAKAHSNPWDKEAIQYILESYPEAAAIKDKHGKTPLQILLDNKAPPSVVMTIVEENPSSLDVHDDNGNTTLLSAMEGDASADVLAAIVQRYPSKAMMVLDGGQTSVNVVMQRSDSAAAVWALLHAYKEFPTDSYLGADKNGRTPLHHGMLIGAPTAAIEILLNAYPQAAAIQDRQGCTPLDLGVAMGVSPSSIKSVLEAFPEAAKLCDIQGDTPLHTCIKQHPSSAVVQTLLQKCEESVAVPNREGLPPLHLAIQRKSDLEIVSAIIDIIPSAVMLKNRDGDTALHLAIKDGRFASVLLIETLLKACPKAAMVEDRQGDQPISIIMRASLLSDQFSLLNKSVVVMESLLARAWPDSLKARDSRGNTPLHHAIEANAGVEILSNFLGRYPAAAALKNSFGKTPVHLAIQLRKGSSTCEKIVKLGLLFRAYPQSTKVKDNDGNTPLLLLLNNAYGKNARLKHGVFYVPRLSASATMHTKDISEIVDLLCDAYPQAAEIENHAGFSPIGLLVNHSFESAKDHVHRLDDGRVVLDLSEFHDFRLLRALLKGLRDGRPLKKFCKLDNPATLNLFFLLFSVARMASENLPEQSDNSVSSIDVNQEVIFGWTFLEILADLDNDDSTNILLQIVQQDKLRKPDNAITINCASDETTLVSFRSVAEAREETMAKVADRAKLSISNEKLREWGQEYGRFLGKYQIDKHKKPKHISETCVVVFATETRIEANGRRRDVQVALKFLSDVDAFHRELDKRNVISTRDSNNSYVISVLACYTTRNQEEMDDSGFHEAHIEFGVHFDLNSYKHIRLNPSDVAGGLQELNYLLVMHCGAGVDLNDVISHQNVAGRNLPLVLSIGVRIAECLRFLNEECGILHGDVKGRNFVSLGVGAGYAVIDLDNAASITYGECTGKKRTSSGYLPPEQAAIEASLRTTEGVGTELAIPAVRAELDDLHRELNAAFHDGKYEEQLVLLQAHKDAQRRLEHLQNSFSPVEPVFATPQYDMWSFGVLLFYLCTGVQLFNMNFREDVNDSDLFTIQNWNKEKLLDKLQTVPEGWPRSLIADLLQPNPTNRPRTWDDVINKLRNVPAVPRSRVAGIRDPCMWSITYWQLMEVGKTASREFGKAYSTMTMRDIADKVIRPRCLASGTSFALALNPNGLMLDAFVSHSWDEPFSAFVASIRKVFQTSVQKPALWICAFALDQCNDEVVHAQVGSASTPLANSPFVRALEHALTFVVVRNATTDLYSRIWCVCELIYANRLGLVPNKTHVTGPDVFSHMRTSCLAAQSTEPEDKTRILQVLLEEHNVDEIDEIVHVFRTQEAPE